MDEFSMDEFSKILNKTISRGFTPLKFTGDKIDINLETYSCASAKLKPDNYLDFRPGTSI